MTGAASWVITDLRLPLLRLQAYRALFAPANRQTRSRVFYWAKLQRIKRGLAGVLERVCYDTH